MIRLLSVLILGALAAPALAQNTGAFTLATTVNGDGTLTPTLTWTTTPRADRCVASGNAAWNGEKAGEGTQALAPVPTTAPQSYALLCTWPGDTQALLTWTPPTQNTDGSPLTNLAGFRVHWGSSPTTLTQTAQIDNPGTATYTVTDLTPGEWFFGVQAFNTQGAESELSNIASKEARAGIEWSATNGVKVPNAPVLSIDD